VASKFSPFMAKQYSPKSSV